MGFEEYLTSQLGSHIDELSKEQVAEIRKLYDKLLIWQNTAEITLKKGLNNSAGIDYTNDYEKAMKQVGEASQELASKIKEYKDYFGIEEFEDASRMKM